MTLPDTLHITPRHALYALGYAFTSAWATILLFSSSFSPANNESIVTLSMLSGVVACLGVLLLRSHVPAFAGRSAAASLYATCMAAGTLLCTFPSLASIPFVHDAGLVLSGFFAILLILTWFDAYARLNARTIVLLAGAALLVSAVTCFAVLALPTEASSAVTAALPLASLACLPQLQEAQRHAGRPALSAIVREAVSWKTLLGVAVAFFVIGVIGALAPQLGLIAHLSPAYLAIPAAIAAVFVLSALHAPARVDASILFKLLLVGVAALAFLLVYYGNTNLSLVFFVFITADVLLWTVLALASKKTPVDAHAVFAIGWLAECIGDVAGHNVGAIMGNTSLLFAIVMLLILVAVGFAFGDGLFVIELEEAQGTVAAGAFKDVAADASGANDANPNRTHAQDGSSTMGADAAPSRSSDADASGTEPDLVASTEAGVDADAASNTEANAGGAGADGTDTQAPVRMSQAQAIEAFVTRHGISAREADVFALWVTGHGQKHIQDTLFISESTVKTHLRSIYRKCDTHSRAEIIALFEQEQEQDQG